MMESRVAGIPCLIDVTHYHNQPPHRGSPWTCDSDVDYYGYTECEFVVCDRRGRKAAWLEKKMTKADEEHIREEIERYMEGGRDDY